MEPERIAWKENSSASDDHPGSDYVAFEIHGSIMTFKEKVETAQAIVTILAVCVGGLWTYNIFIKEREDYPHANIEQKLSHVALSRAATLLRVGIEVTNTGKSRLRSARSIIAVQKILPLAPCQKGDHCAADEVNNATKSFERGDDRFSWPLVAERTSDLKYSLDIESGEKEVLDFEFVVPADINVVRVYSYSRNDEKLKDGLEVGWAASSYYDFRTAKGGRNENKDRSRHPRSRSNTKLH